MRKVLCVLLVFTMMISSFCFVSFGKSDIRLTINGDVKTYVIAPHIVEGEIFVPVMDVFKDLSCETIYVSKMHTVSVKRNNVVVKMTTDSKDAYINGTKYTLENHPRAIAGKLMVPAEFFLDAIGDTGVYNEATNTYIIESDYLRRVAYQPTLAPLYSDVHRDIPTEFSTGNSYDDIRYYSKEEIEGNLIIPEGDSILTQADLISHMKFEGNSSEYVSQENVTTPYGEGLRFRVNAVPSKETDAFCQLDTKVTGFEEGDTLVLTMKMRRISGGDPNGQAYIRVQMQERTSGKFDKNLYEYIVADKEWTEIRIPFEAKTDYDSFGIRMGYFVQEFEIADLKISNIKDALSVTEIPYLTSLWPDFHEDAPWRKTAFENIDKYRKGNLKVVVKDRFGNLVPDASVNFDMFESEFKFGTAISGVVKNNETYRKNLGKYFNSAVVEHMMKWGPYVDNPAELRKQINGAVESGIKDIRGHAVIWEQKFASDGKTYLIPEYCFNEDGSVVDLDTLKALIEEHMYNIFFEYAGEIFEWDVVNELADNKEFLNVYGDSMIDFYIETARKYSPWTRFFYNEKVPGVTAEMFDEYNRLIEYIADKKMDVDGIGFQSHSESRRLRTIGEVNEQFDRASELGFDIGVTEYSYSVADKYLQANYTRDYFINAFSHPKNNEFLIWGFWDGNLYADYSPMFDKEWNMNLAGEQLTDLMYNKFWTRNQGATTDENGQASINGFYGDYDVTVSVGESEKTVSCAYHKGYDNVLEIVLDDYPADNSENDMFSFVYSGKVQIEGKLTSDITDNHPDYLKNSVTLLMTDKYGNIAHIAQTQINPDKTYSFEFMKDGLKYENNRVEDYYVSLNVNGMLVTDTITTNMIIPQCVTFDIDITNSDGKVNVETTLNNLIRRKGLDYVVYTAFYGEKNTLKGFKRTNSSSTGESMEKVTVSGLDIPDNTKYVKVFVWMNNRKMIPLSTAKQIEIG